MRWAALTTRTKATIVVSVAAAVWLGGVGSATALVGTAIANADAPTAAPSASASASAQPLLATPKVTLTPTPTPTPVVLVTKETQDTEVPFERTRVDDPNLPKGQERVTTKGVAGVLTTTWQITTIDGVESKRVEIGKEVTRAPIAEVTAVGSYVAPAPPAPTPAPAPDPAPEGQAPGLITPGAFCSDAQNGAVAQAANGRSYQCGGKGPDSNGHLHWNSM